MNTTPKSRLDLYAPIHKALRLAMMDTLARLGSLDVADAGQRIDTIAQLRSLLDLCRSHVDKEQHHVHPAIEARCAGLSRRLDDEHAHHLAAIDMLEADTVAFHCAPDAAAAARLYRRLALFVAENLVHMEYEETVHNAALWAVYSDDELMRMHQAIVASMPPDAMAQVLNWMLPALSHDERAGMLEGLRATAPAPAYEGALRVARQRLPEAEWAKLMRRLQPQACAA